MNTSFLYIHRLLDSQQILTCRTKVSFQVYLPLKNTSSFRLKIPFYITVKVDEGSSYHTTYRTTGSCSSGKQGRYSLYSSAR